MVPYRLIWTFGTSVVEPGVDFDNGRGIHMPTQVAPQVSLEEGNNWPFQRRALVAKYRIYLILDFQYESRHFQAQRERKAVFTDSDLYRLRSYRFRAGELKVIVGRRTSPSVKLSAIDDESRIV